MPSLIIRAGSAAGIFQTVEGLTAPGIAEAIEPDGLMTITPLNGGSFGTASISHALYDDFRGQTNGATVSTSAVVGTYDSVTASAQISTAQSKMGSGRSFLHAGAGILNFNFPLSTGFRGSFWLYAPTDPGDTTGGRSKTSWVMQGNDGATGEGQQARLDLAFPTKHFTSNTGWGIAGNDYNLELSIGRWIAGAEWARAFFSFSSTNGYRIVLLSPTFGMFEVSEAANVFDIDPETVSTGVDWWKLGPTTDPTYYYDGIQCHIGEGANACVEIGDAESYEDCTQLFDCDIGSWSTGQVVGRARCPASALVPGSTWVHIHLANRNHENNGIGRLIS